MKKVQTVKKLAKGNKRQILIAIYNNIVHTGITNLLPDELYLKLTYWIRFGKKLNLCAPVSFNEKLQWLKLNDHNPNYTIMVDKVKAKQYVADLIGDKYIIPTLGVWDKFEDIRFDLLPNQFVLKCNHDSGSIVICKDKATFNIIEAKKKITKGLNRNAYYWGREWPYKNVEKKILAETYMQEPGREELRDYKFMVFNGEVKCSFVCSDRFSEDGLKVTFYDRNWKVMPFERHYPRSKSEIEKPVNYEQMVNLAETLSNGIPFARVDFYEIKGKIYFGEITFFPGSGWEEFTPAEWDERLGEWINLPKRS